MVLVTIQITRLIEVESRSLNGTVARPLGRAFCRRGDALPHGRTTAPGPHDLLTRSLPGPLRQSHSLHSALTTRRRASERGRRLSWRAHPKLAPSKPESKLRLRAEDSPAAELDRRQLA